MRRNCRATAAVPELCAFSRASDAACAATHAQSAVSENLIAPRKEGFSECALDSISSFPGLCFNGFLKEFCTATTSLDDHRNGGVLDRDRSARFNYELPSQAAALICRAGL